MASPSSSRSRLIFGPYEVNLNAGEITRRGIPLRLAPKPFQILLTLLTQPGDVVTRGQLRQQLWADDTFASFEHQLNTAVDELRQALDDSAEDPRYIETIPERGYRFIGSIGPQIEHPPPPPVKSVRKLVAITILVVIVVIVAYVLGVRTR